MKYTFKYAFCLWLIVVLLFMSSCVGTRVNFQQSIDSMENYDLSKGRQIYSEASGFQLLLLIPISLNSRHTRAYTILLAQADGGYISNIKVQEAWSYGFVGTQYTTRMEATVYPKK